MEVTPLHLFINLGWENGQSQNLQLLENRDLGVILARGQDAHVVSSGVPHDPETGLFVVALGVNEDHEEVHYIQPDPHLATPPRLLES